MVDDITGTNSTDAVNAAMDSIRSSFISGDLVSSHPAIVSVTFLENSDNIDPGNLETPLEAQTSSSTISLGAVEWAVILGGVAAFASIGMIAGRRYCISR